MNKALLYFNPWSCFVTGHAVVDYSMCMVGDSCVYRAQFQNGWDIILVCKQDGTVHVFDKKFQLGRGVQYISLVIQATSRGFMNIAVKYLVGDRMKTACNVSISPWGERCVDGVGVDATWSRRQFVKSVMLER